MACKAPISLKRGDVLFSFEGVSYTDATSAVEQFEWTVRNVTTRSTYKSEDGLRERTFTRKAVFVSLVIKEAGVTWIDGKWARMIPKSHQKKFELKERLPKRIYTTRLKAIKFAVKDAEINVCLAQSEIDKANADKAIKRIEVWSEEIQNYKMELKLLSNHMKKLINIKIKPKKTKNKKSK